MSYKYCRKHDNIVREIKLKDTVMEYCPACKKRQIFEMMGYKIYHKEVQRFHDSDARVKACWAPRRTTKSYSGAHDLLLLYLLPETITWIVAPSYEIGEKEFRVMHQRLVLEADKLGIDKPLRCYNSIRTGNLSIESKQKSIIRVKSAERPVSLLGEAVDGILYSEGAQLKRDIRERYTMQTTVTTAKERGTGYEIIPTTPLGSAEWVHELCMEGQKSDNKRLIESFHWDYTANPKYDVQELENAKKTLGANSPAFREQYLGDWVFYGGSVYSNFNEDTHIIEPFEIPKHWHVVRAIDFGVRDPFVCLWGAIGPDSEIYLFDEYYFTEGGRSMKHHAQFIKEKSKNMKVIQTVADPSATQSIEDLNQEGVFAIPADNDHMSGRLRVMEYLTCTPDGPRPYPLRNTKSKKNHPRMYIFKTMKDLLREFRYYRFKERRYVQSDKEVTLGDDHAMDCLRYLSMTRPAPFRLKFKHTMNSIFGVMNKIKIDRLNRNQWRLG